MLCADVGGVTKPRDTTLSVCCLTRGPTSRVAAQLALLRDVADEIVVGLDTSVAAELAHPLEDVADVLGVLSVRRPGRPPRGLGAFALHTRVELCSFGSTTTIPSAALVSTVRAAITDSAVTHCFVPRRTLWRDAATALVGPPWAPDFQLRLVRNDRRVVWFPASRTGRSRRWGRTATWTRRCTTPTCFSIRSSAGAQRCASTRAAIPGPRVAGLPMNDAAVHFLPEDREDAHVAPIDPVDRETVARILALQSSPAPGRRRGQSRRLARRGRRALEGRRPPTRCTAEPWCS